MPKESLTQKDIEIVNSFIDACFTAFRNFSVDRIKNKIAELYDTDENQQKLIEFIIFKVLDAYQITRHELFHSKNRNGSTDARNTCYVLFHKHLDINQKDIGKLFNKSHTVVNLAIKKLRDMNKTIKVEREFLEKYEAITKEIDDYKVSIISKYCK